MKQLEKLNRLTESHGALRPGKGMISGVIALSLAILCFLGVLAFHFPEYLTTPQLRKSYNVDVMRLLLFWSLVLDPAQTVALHETYSNINVRSDRESVPNEVSRIARVERSNSSQVAATDFP